MGDTFEQRLLRMRLPPVGICNLEEIKRKVQVIIEVPASESFESQKMVIIQSAELLCREKVKMFGFKFYSMIYQSFPIASSKHFKGKSDEGLGSIPRFGICIY